MVILFERRYRKLGRVYVCDGGRLGNLTLPEDFTDRGLPGETTPLNAEVLANLVAIVSAIEGLTERRE